MKHTIFAIFCTLFIFQACTKEEGTGGQSTIKGKVVRIEYSVDSSIVTKRDSMVIQREIPAINEDVYIIYGDKSSIGDKVVTSPDGTFEFNFLQAGKYKIVTYSDDTLNILNKQMPGIKEISIGDSKTSDIGSLKVYKKLDIDNGNGSISGCIILKDWSKNFIEIQDIRPAQEMDVYLKYGNHISFDFRVRTSYDGTYVFPNLVKGRYTFIVYTAHINGGFTGATYKTPKLIDTIISKDNEHIVIKDIYVDME
jgi:hypothetical protein